MTDVHCTGHVDHDPNSRIPAGWCPGCHPDNCQGCGLAAKTDPVEDREAGQRRGPGDAVPSNTMTTATDNATAILTEHAALIQRAFAARREILNSIPGYTEALAVLEQANRVFGAATGPERFLAAKAAIDAEDHVANALASAPPETLDLLDALDEIVTHHKEST